MAQMNLSQKFLETRGTSANLLLELYREPSITAYNRLEPRARTEDFGRSLRAEVRDALWMLTRQWQMGELEAEDAGSAVDARLLTHQLHVDRVAPRGQDGRHYDENLPLEPMVERERIPFTHALKVQTGHYFLKLHTPALRAKYSAAYQSAFPFDQGREEDFRGQVNGLNLYVATRRRDIDGEKLWEALHDGTFAIKAGIESGDATAVEAFTRQLQDWMARQYVQPAGSAESAWDPQQLTYRFSAAAPRSDGRQLVLEAAHYHQDHLDWYAVDVNPGASPLTSDTPEADPPLPNMDKAISFLPVAATFKGMPQPRFWEMEDRQVNFGNLNAQTTDHLLLLFAELGLVYGNDWFVIPYTLPVNTLCEVRGLVVTDVFGERTLIQAAGEGDHSTWQRWSMFSLSTQGQPGSNTRQFFLPATLTQTLESEPIEQVNFIRDEMANMVWGVEDQIPDATGAGLSGHEAASKEGIQPPPVPESAAQIRYALGTSVPENWIPFLPVHKPGSNQDICFQRAAMPKLGVPPREVIQAKGVLLREVPSPYYINEEEIPYSGTIVSRSYQRVRWYDGRTFVWIGRYRENGRGQGSSLLRFDQIEPVKKAPAG